MRHLLARDYRESIVINNVVCFVIRTSDSAFTVRLKVWYRRIEGKPLVLPDVMLGWVSHTGLSKKMDGS